MALTGTEAAYREGVVHKKIRKTLIDTFGGNVKEGDYRGAALNPEVEAFLMKIGFPISVGYGMTECSPIISYAGHRQFCNTLRGVFSTR